MSETKSYATGPAALTWKELPARSKLLLRLMGQSVWHHRLAWTLVAGGIVVFNTFFEIGFNVTYSLPETMYIVEKGVEPKRGDYVAFRWGNQGFYPEGDTFIKILAGVPGDVVTRQGRDFFVNGKFVGHAKTHSLKGVPLDVGRTGVLGPGQYYVMAPHKDSLDSRYAVTGWIERKDFIGKAYGFF
jgi:conjugal transfer pilin signal peptidase TrbI